MAIASSSMRKIPPGILLLRRIRGRDWGPQTYRCVVLLLTFMAYACYHASRKPSSIVKSVLDPEPNSKSLGTCPWPIGNVFLNKEIEGFNRSMSSRRKGWDPFDEKDATSKLGELDVAFLACYSLGMYAAGHLGDTLDLRLFLTWGMIGSGLFVGLFGVGYFWNVHVFSFFLLMQMVAGLFQATGWPSVVAVVGNWFGKRKRGLIMGIWNAHTSIGNISGSLIAAGVLDYGWGWSFIAPGLIMILGGMLIYLFLAAYPEDVGFPDISSNSGKYKNVSVNIEGDEGPTVEVLGENKDSISQGSASKRSVGLSEACRIPGVIPFALCLFFTKLVAYTFLYWLPFYLSHTAIGGEYMSEKSAGNLSTLFDVGGIVGGILAGYISDKFNARATTAATFMYAAIPSMLLYQSYGSISKTVNIALMMIAGLFVNGPYALITTAVSADLGTHESLRDNSRALATVTAIIDGTGSVGAAIGPLLTGFLSTMGWQAVFYMLVAGALTSGLLLTQLVINEIREKAGHGEEASASEPLLNGRRR